MDEMSWVHTQLVARGIREPRRAEERLVVMASN
jgi:hypothetical protein